MAALTIAALYVDPGGVYAGREGVDPWDQDRDARGYRGPGAVVAHPPCQRWGRWASGGPSYGGRYRLGEDGGCFAHALWAVRSFGGVLEHPKDSRAWQWFGLPPPAVGDSWGHPDAFGGRSCRIDQGVYGFTSPKPTWLYAVGNHPPLDWSRDKRRPNHIEPRRRREGVEPDPNGYTPITQLPSQGNARSATPERLAMALIDLARGVG